MSATSIDVCAGGTVSTNQITFTNNHPTVCTITGLGTLVDCGNSFTVPARSGGTAGSKTCNILANATPGTYSYNPNVCDDATNPSIVYS